jgi:ABC-type microcin C transport system duplicated ATPase subunit YejF
LYHATDGSVTFKGKDIYSLKSKELKEFNREMQMIFQDPYASLNPRMTVLDIVAEGIDIHGLATGEERRKRVIELLKVVGLNEEHADRFPHEFSGGQRCTGGRTGIHYCRRTDFRLGRVDSGASGQPDEKVAKRKRTDLSVHCA